MNLGGPPINPDETLMYADGFSIIPDGPLMFPAIPQLRGPKTSSIQAAYYDFCQVMGINSNYGEKCVGRSWIPAKIWVPQECMVPPLIRTAIPMSTISDMESKTMIAKMMDDVFIINN